MRNFNRKLCFRLSFRAGAIFDYYQKHHPDKKEVEAKMMPTVEETRRAAQHLGIPRLMPPTFSNPPKASPKGLCYDDPLPFF